MPSRGLRVLAATAALAFAALATPLLAAGPCAPMWTNPFAGPGGVDYAEVYTLAALDDDGPGPHAPALYVGGSFTRAGGVIANHIAKWDGSAWYALGSGLTRDVHAITLFDDDGSGPNPPMLYATTTALWRWDGATWSVAPGWNTTAPIVLCMCVFDEDGDGPNPASLFVGGRSTFSAGPLSGVNIARYGSGGWSALASGVTGLGGISSLAIHDDDGPGPHALALYVGGQFTTAGGMPAVHVAKWDGAAWSSLGSGVPSSSVGSLASFDEDGAGPNPPRLFATGGFTVAGGAAGDRIARWDGATWTSVGNSGISAQPIALCVWDDDGAGPNQESLYVAGTLHNAGGVQVGNLAKWDGVSWSAPAAPVDGTIYALAVFDPDTDGPAPQSLCCAGRFTQVGSLDAMRIAKLTAGAWAPLGVGVGRGSNVGGFSGTLALGSSPGAFASIIVDSSVQGFAGPTLVVAGAFSSAGYKSAHNIAAWDGSAWHTLGAGTSAGVNALAIFDDDGPVGPHPPMLYASLRLLTAHASGWIVRWDGAAWVPAGDAHFFTYVGDLAVFDDDGPGPHLPALFATGTLETSDGQYIADLSRWDGATWTGVIGPQGNLTELAVFDEDGPGILQPSLFVGDVWGVNDVPYQGIAKWNGTLWSPVGAGLAGDLFGQREVFAFAQYDDDGPGPHLPVLLVGGIFGQAGGLPTSNIAAWNGSAWSALGGAGLQDELGTGSVTSISVFDDDGAGSRKAHANASGTFVSASGVPVANFARWNGSAWSSLGDGLSSGASCMTLFDTDGAGITPAALYVGGIFGTAGGITVDHVAAITGCLPCPADLNADGAVGSADLGILLGSWGPTPNLADLNADGRVNSTDLSLVLGSWGPCP